MEKSHWCIPLFHLAPGFWDCFLVLALGFSFMDRVWHCLLEDKTNLALGGSMFIQFMYQLSGQDHSETLAACKGFTVWQKKWHTKEQKSKSICVGVYSQGVILLDIVEPLTFSRWAQTNCQRIVRLHYKVWSQSVISIYCINLFEFDSIN